MRAKFAFSIAVLGLLALAPSPAAATAITYDFSGTLAFGPSINPADTAITGQFTIDFDSETITGFDFHTPVTELTPSTWMTEIDQFTPAVNPADNFVVLSFFNGDGTLALVFRTTLGAFDGSTFYTGLVEIDGGGTGSGFECRFRPSCVSDFGSSFVSALATPHTDPPPSTVPEPTTLALLGGGLVALSGRFTSRYRER